MGLSPGDLIDDKYRIVRLIGEGGMGAVYEGENTRIRRRVAIKVLHGNVAGMADAVARFEREAQAAGRIGSEHIVEVLDLGDLPSGDRYMVMEFMDGDSLSQRIRQRGRMLPAELYPVTRQLLDALSAAHGAGIVHRDLKPDNVFLLRSRRAQPDFVKLLDFGISKFGGANNALSMTRTGAVMGTPYYMAPEQAKGSRDLDHRVDLYAVGVILYEALAGEVPFIADTFNELLFKIVLESARPLLEVVPETDPGLAALVERAMARDPAHRFQSAEDMQRELDIWAAQVGLLQRAPERPGSSAFIEPPPPTLAAPMAARPLGSTNETWAGTHIGSEPPKKGRSRAPLIAALAALSLVGLGVVGLVLLGGKSEDRASGSLSSGSAVAAPPASVVQAPREPASKVEAPIVEPAPSAPPAAAPKPVQPAAVAARAVVQAPAHRPAPAAAPAAKPKEGPTTSTASGRRIRQSL
jgi:eukaryotic-like serine/threonine-protein kinase